MWNSSEAAGLLAAVQAYFDLMYEGDLSTFEAVFAPSAQLTGLRDGQMTVLSAASYREVLAGRAAPKSQGAPREEQVLLLDFASPTQALVKLRVRVGPTRFVDYLTYHRVGGTWLVTSKGYHAEPVPG
ncbi:nuclear transport factor 2 family protein [Xanthobacter pseudotagetidis]|uniref:nuclear transport factor 2 family protein n=1 Tax=Xanthobacter pseudotagetidis TaxID=3119911 RepID=UPI00372AF0AD